MGERVFQANWRAVFSLGFLADVSLCCGTGSLNARKTTVKEKQKLLGLFY